MTWRRAWHKLCGSCHFHRRVQILQALLPYLQRPPLVTMPVPILAQRLHQQVLFRRETARR